MKKTALAAALLALTASLAPAPARAQDAAREEERVTLNTEDGWALNARWLPPAAGEPALVLVHAQKSGLTEWQPLFRQIARQGFGYLALDLRGHGNSFVAPDGSTASWKTFAIDGQDNEFNKMTRDVEAALAFLSTHSVTGDRTVLVGSLLGANLAIKTAAIHPEVAAVVAVSPVLNVNAVLSVNPLRAYGRRPILIVAGADRTRQYAEAQILYRTAQLTCGRENVAILVEPKGFGPGLVNKYNIRRVLEWVRHPRLPDIVEISTFPAAGLEPGATGQLPVPGEEDEPAEYPGE